MTTQEQVDAQNKATSAEEVASFKTNPPEKYLVYVKQIGRGNIVHVTTWMGDKLGEGTLGREYKCPAFGGFTSTRQSIWFYGINGYSYVGTYYTSSGDYARVRMTAKGKRKLAYKKSFTHAANFSLEKA